MHPSPRALSLAASIGWRHATADPVRALLLAWRVLPVPLRGWLSLAGPYGRATVLWGTGERDAALMSLAASPRRQAAFALAADQPAAAAAALSPSTRRHRCWPPAWPGAKAASPTPSTPWTTPPAGAPAASAPPSPASEPSWPPPRRADP